MKKLRLFIKISMTNDTIIIGHDFALSISDEIKNQSFTKQPIFFDGSLYMYSNNQYTNMDSSYVDYLDLEELSNKYILKQRLKKLSTI